MYWKSSFHGTFCALPPPTLPWATILVVGTRDLSLGCCLGRGLSLFTMDFMWSFQPPLQGTIDMSSWVDLTQPLFKILMHIVQIVKTIPEWKGTCQGQWTRLLGSTWPNHCSRSTGLFYKFTCPLCESWKPYITECVGQQAIEPISQPITKLLVPHLTRICPNSSHAPNWVEWPISSLFHNTENLTRSTIYEGRLFACFALFVLMRSTKPRCFRLCSWSLWKLLRRMGALAWFHGI
jgi:hypothetical protein